ncbi:carbohydrate kinase [Pontiellaceae bacterium B12227]|nr:carbohydrate kinase [Pontiellaceae bacterium B12227]
MKEIFTVAGIGELLWDVFPNHRRLGGAPANFAYHTHQLGAEAYPVSCVGADPLGNEIREQLRKLDVDSAHVVETAAYPTGTVDVVLSAGKPTYEIHEDVAWDHISFSDDLREVAETLDAVCFGSLSQRSAESRKSIHAFLQSMPKGALKIYDVNLRQAFFSKNVVQESLELASVLKLSDEELPVLADYFELKGDTIDQLMELRRLFDLALIAYTRGPDGSLLLGKYEFDDFPGCEGKAVDSVGAGDSYTAAMCMGVLHGWPLNEVNLFANEVSTFVCMQKGATPILPAELVGKVVCS